MQSAEGKQRTANNLTLKDSLRALEALKEGEVELRQLHNTEIAERLGEYLGVHVTAANVRHLREALGWESSSRPKKKANVAEDIDALRNAVAEIGCAMSDAFAKVSMLLRDAAYTTDTNAVGVCHSIADICSHVVGTVRALTDKE